MRGYPALVDEGTSVALRVESTPDAAARATRAGVRRLVLLAVPSPTAYVQEHLTSAEKLALATSPYPSARALIEDCRVAVADAIIARVAPSGHRAARRTTSPGCATPSRPASSTSSSRASRSSRRC